MSTDWSEYVQLPESTTPLKLRNPKIDNLQSYHQENGKKRGPTTPLTPTLLNKNIIKKPYINIQKNIYNQSTQQKDEVITLDKDVKRSEVSDNRTIQDELNKQETEESYLFTQQGSPKSRKSTPLLIRKTTDITPNVTPKIRNGIRLAVKEHKKSRLQIIKNLESVDNSSSDSEYSEASTIAGDTPNYKVNDNLVYYKNGYYVHGNDDFLYEMEKENIIKNKELSRVNDLLEFMKVERQFERDFDETI